jgi:hypothetical protein
MSLIHHSYNKSVFVKYGIEEYSWDRSQVIKEFIDGKCVYVARNIVKKQTDHIKDNYKIISLGASCFVRYVFSFWGLKKLKEEGELSCPFDLSINRVTSIIPILNENFKQFLNEKYLICDGKNIHNQYYNSWYIHEFPENTSNIIEKFKDRYSKRIRNFYQYCFSNKFLFFVHHDCKITKDKMFQLEESLHRFSWNGNAMKNYKLIFLHDNAELNFETDIIISKAIPLPSEDYKWNLNTHAKTSLGMEHDLKWVDFLKDVILTTIS